MGSIISGGIGKRAAALFTLISPLIPIKPSCTEERRDGVPGFADRLISVVIDRFGKETDIRRLAEERFQYPQ